MKTAVSLPNNVFREAERLARQTRLSRSRMYSLALQEYLARHAPDRVTDAMNNACAGLESHEHRDAFTQAAAQKILHRSEW